MLRKNFNVKSKMKQVAGGEVMQELVSHCVERGETEASRGVWRVAFVNRNNLHTHSFSPRLSGSILFFSFKI